MSIYMTGGYFHKKIILIFALVAFLVIVIFPTHTIIAQSAGSVSNGATVGSNPAGNTPAGQAVPSGQPKVDHSGADTNEEIKCIKWAGGTIPYPSPTGCAAYIAFTILQVASWVLWVAAILFNSTINYTLNMAGFIKDIPIVAVGWTTFRDVTNLMFIFIILYIAISTIVGNEGYGIKKLLGKVIVGAMLINFSLFFTQAMIDGSNIIALQFYHKIRNDAAGQNIKSGKAGSNTDYDAGISAAFVNAMGLQQIYFLGKGSSNGGPSNETSGTNLEGTKLGLNASNLILVGLGGTVLVLITAFVFFAATFMLLARTVVLVFLMILSPVAFMGNILPALGKYTGEWWSKLTSNLLFAPVYMMLLYLVMNMILGGSFKGANGGGGTFADMFAGGSNWIPTVLTFVVLIMLMLGCLIIASKLGVIGSKWAEKTGMGMAKSLGMSLSGANKGLAFTRGALGMAGGVVTAAARPLAASGVGRVFGGAALLRGGQALKDTKLFGKSYKDQQKATEERITKEYEAIKETDTNLVQGRRESDADFTLRKDAAKALEKKRQGQADKRIGVSIDPTTGKVVRKSFGVPQIFGGTSGRFKAQKELAKKRGSDDVDKELKKPFEDIIDAAKLRQKQIFASGYKPGDNTHASHADYIRNKKEIKDAVASIKEINGAFVPPKT